jgi:hypothetical protein
MDLFKYMQDNLHKHFNRKQFSNCMEKDCSQEATTCIVGHEAMP